MKRITLLLIAILSAMLAASLLPGCATIQNPNSVSAISEQGANQFGVIKELQTVQAKNPAEAKQLANLGHEGINTLKVFLGSPDAKGLTLDTLKEHVTNYIGSKHLDAATLIAIETVRQIVDLEIADVAADKNIGAGILTEQQIAGLLTMAGKIDAAITLAGFPPS